MTDKTQACTLVTSIDEGFVNAVTPALHPRYRVIHCRPQQADVERAIRSFEPDVCIIDVDDLKWDDNFHLELIEEVSLLTAAPVVVATYDLTTSLMLESLRAGARDVCEKTGRAGEIQDVIDNLLRRRHKGRGDQAAHLITIQGARPGVGATTLALALGEAVARRLRDSSRVLLMDFSLPPAEIPDFMALAPSYYLTDAVQDVARLDDTFIDNALAKAPHAPLYLLPLCRSPEEQETLETTDIVLLLSVLKSYFHTIIIDGNAVWRPDLAARFLLDADAPVLCASQSVSAVHAGVQMVRRMRSETQSFDFHLAVTRHCDRISPAAEDMAATLGVTGRTLVVEEDRPFVEMARNLGEPLMREVPRCRFEKSVQAVVAQLLPDLPTPRRRPILGGLSPRALLKEASAGSPLPLDVEASRG